MDGTKGLALTAAAMMMYPFALRDGGGGGGGAVGGLLLGRVGGGVGQVHLHVIRHFFQEVRGNQSAMAVHLPLRSSRRVSGRGLPGGRETNQHVFALPSSLATAVEPASLT